ncbi:DNA-binding Lrp family transcriptional regulator [Rhodococcus sp. OK519]|uniref:Lrp/AsnC family transcriptional regulator n=1 Tax=Rhodococcus sp. OK519 TaxID=2135729 RepID=UPI000D34893F|nr:DNA-binding Lrp family transcriptional regulator [Rhodococcus sp. OK519]
MSNGSVQESDALDELDLSLINTLQLGPRASWAQVGAALGVDPVTAARRWSRLVESGSAWVTAHPAGPQAAALIEIECVAGQVLPTAEILVRWPHVLTVEHTSGSRDLLLTVSVRDLAALSDMLLNAVEQLPGIRSTRTHLVIRPYAMGGDWQLRALDAEQRAHLDGRGPRASGTLRPLDDTDRALIACLSRNGRATLTDLAATLGCSVSTARRRVDALLDRHSLLLRCDVAQPLSGWPVSVWMWAHVPVDECDAVAQHLTALPETRACLVLTGAPANFFYSVWVRSLADVHRIEQLLRRTVPSLEILDRSVTLRFFKRMGRILDESGRSVECVPMDIWSDPVEGARGL